MLTTQSKPVPDKFQESILVVPRAALQLDWQGLKTTDLAPQLAVIQAQPEFHPRGLMEQDERYKQIIPYLIFQYQDQLFLMQRSAQASETRLQQKFTLGIGGHLRARDLAELDQLGLARTTNDVSCITGASTSFQHDLASLIFAWAQREFHEEVAYAGKLQLRLLGLLNDDSNSVGRVHLGLVLLLTGDTPEIKVKSELQSGQLVDFDTCRQHLLGMETWSQVVFEAQWTSSQPSY